MAERILVIKHGALGDFIFAAGIMQGIREKHPDAHIALMTMGMFTKLGKELRCFDEIFVDNRVSYWNLPATYAAISSILKGDFDMIYDLQCSSRTLKRYFPIVRFFSKRPFLWVDCWGGARRVQKTGIGKGETQIVLETIPLRAPDLRCVQGKGEHFDELPERYVMLIPGCSPAHPYKRWSPAHYSEIAKRLADKGIHSLVIGTKAEEKEINEIAASTPMAINFLGKSSLLDIPAMAARALACIGNDTGPTHMSSFCGTPVISIFSRITQSSTESLRTVPDAIPLVSPEDDINAITVDRVWDVLMEKIH